MPKEDLYKGIKIVGFVTFIPFMLAAGPLSGYFVGTFLQKRFNLSSYCVFLGVFIGFLVAITEVVKILKAVAKVNKK
jgi:F0F1-type ATP synthase assembly protein I